MKLVSLDVTAVMIGNDWYGVHKDTFETDEEHYFSFVALIGGSRISGPVTSIQALKSKNDADD